MNTAQIEANIEALMGSWSKDTFIYELLLAYGVAKSTVTRAMKGTANMSKEPGVVQLKTKVLFKPVQGQDLYVAVEQASKQATHKERFVIVTDFKTLLAKDMSGKATPLETPFDELHKHYAYFLPWAGLEKTAVVNENPADRKAAEKLARLYDDLKEANNVESDEQRHALNVFLTRLLFCFFAEDTGIFEDGQFSVGLGSHTADDGSDSSEYLRRLFRIMGTPEDQRESLPKHLEAFPFVGKSLFGDDLPVPEITRKGRSTILAAGDLDWAAINPDIFGSMIQAVVSEENRGELGMHYTSVPNIMKVIGPLFLDELLEELDKAKGSDTRLRKLLHRIHNLQVFDPACGSGNFLIITYKELRRLEMTILKQFNELPISGIRLDHFHGIEIDDFAHETAKLSMWLAEHQMNREFEEVMGRPVPSLPLGLSSNIVFGNSSRKDWIRIVGDQSDGDSEVVMIGNPPYLGGREQTAEMKEDLMVVYEPYRKAPKVDYVAVWLMKSIKFMKALNAEVGFVTTSSIFQGEQVEMIWPWLIKNGVRISFAHLPFKWSNNAKGGANVYVVAFGLTLHTERKCILYKDLRSKAVKKIGPYLIADSELIVVKRKVPISEVPSLNYGNMALDGGNLLLTPAERDAFKREYSEIEAIMRPVIGAREFLGGKKKYCIWVEDEMIDFALNFPPVRERIEKVKVCRLKSGLGRPHQFREMREAKNFSIFIPTVSTARRRYLPIGLLKKEEVVLAPNQVLYDPPVHMMSIVSSTMHMVWLRTVGGRLKTDYRYSKDLVYNTFPFPSMSKQKEEELAMCSLRILEVRERYPDRSLAELYDPDKMPEDLLEAHKLNDEAVERCYRVRPFESDEDRLQVLFDLYTKMTAEEADRGSLFESSKTKKKRKRHA